MYKQSLVVFFLLFLVSGFGVFNQWRQLQQTPIKFDSPYFELKKGTSLAMLCQQLRQQQLLKSSHCWQLKLAGLAVPELRKLKAGVYQVQPQTLFQLLALLRSGKVAQFSLILREGWTLQQNLQALQNKDYLQVDIQQVAQLQDILTWPEEWGTPAEGFEGLVLPQTYFYTAHSKLSDVLRRANQHLLQQLTQQWQNRAADLPYATPYQLLIMASIIEKETGQLAEKPLIAAVFINRLRQKMKLQTDPTVIYGLGDSYQGDITRQHLKTAHPYNTYVHFGLPPGPITSVSVSSLQAAAQPEPTEYLYFVAKGDGSHQFSSTLQQHNQAVQRYIFGKQP